MPVPRHAWWRGSELTWRRPKSLTADVAGSAAPPFLARQCRTIHHGAAGIDLNAQHYLNAQPQG